PRRRPPRARSCGSQRPRALDGRRPRSRHGVAHDARRRRPRARGVGGAAGRCAHGRRLDRHVLDDRDHHHSAPHHPADRRAEIALTAMLWLTLALAVGAGSVSAPPATRAPVVLDVPYLPQTEALCGAAAAAMVFRYWGDVHADIQSFHALVDRKAGGIATTTL